MEIKEIMLNIPGHDFVKIPILHDDALLGELRMLVTTEPTTGVMTTPTGIPPHVELATNVQKLLSMVTDLVNCLGKQTNGLIDAVKTAIENQAWDSGHITGSKLKEILEEFNNKQLKVVEDRLVEVRDEFRTANVGNNRPAATRVTPARRAAGNSTVTTLFMYDGKFYGVPKDYEFPKKLTIGEALRFYLNGQSVSDDGSARVRPFAKLSCELLPKRLRTPFTLDFRRIFGFIEQGVEMTPARDGKEISNEIMEEILRKCEIYLEERVEYCFLLQPTRLKNNKSKQAKTPMQWTIGSWGTKVSRSSIETKGTASDKANLGEKTGRNGSRPGLKRKGHQKEKPLYRKRQNDRLKKRGTSNRTNNRNDESGDEDGFAAAFADVPALTERGRARDAEIQENVNADMAVEQQAMMAHRQAVGDAVGHNGDLLFVHRPAPGIRTNHGDNSTLSRERAIRTLQSAGVVPRPSKPTQPGLCDIPGCRNCALVPDHPCYRDGCNKYVHNLCGQAKFLTSSENELNHYCSVACKGAD